MWIDTHAHLAEAAFDADRLAVIERAKAQQIDKIMLIGANLDGAQRAVSLSRSDAIFDVAIGFHPQDILEIQRGEWEALCDLLKDERVVAIGEIGLDYYWQKDAEVQAQQRELFIRQLQLADEVDKPVIIHCRDAMQDCYDILKAHRPKRAIIMHCFSGSLPMAQRFVELGCYISLAGPLTFKNARVPKEVALGIDVEHLMIETDSPYLAPDPHRGKRNESAYVKLVGSYLAQLKGITEAKLAKALTQNYQDFLEKK